MLAWLMNMDFAGSGSEVVDTGPDGFRKHHPTRRLQDYPNSPFTAATLLAGLIRWFS